MEFVAYSILLIPMMLLGEIQVFSFIGILAAYLLSREQDAKMYLGAIPFALAYVNALEEMQWVSVPLPIVYLIGIGVACWYVFSNYVDFFEIQRGQEEKVKSYV